jgi:hypothetical protein
LTLGCTEKYTRREIPPTALTPECEKQVITTPCREGGCGVCEPGKHCAGQPLDVVLAASAIFSGQPPSVVESVRHRPVGLVRVKPEKRGHSLTQQTPTFAAEPECHPPQEWQRIPADTVNCLQQSLTGSRLDPGQLQNSLIVVGVLLRSPVSNELTYDGVMCRFVLESAEPVRKASVLEPSLQERKGGSSLDYWLKPRNQVWVEYR